MYVQFESTIIMMEATRVTIDSSNSFIFVACCTYLDHIQPSHSSTILALRPREPDFSLFCLARDEGSVVFRGHTVQYRIESSDPVPTDSKPEPFRQLHLSTQDERSVLIDLVSTAVDQHRLRVTAPRGQPGTGVMRYVWDDDAQCWDSGKLIPHRSLDTMFLPTCVAEDTLCDLGAYLKQETIDQYASLHVAPVRVYMLYGVPGGGKTSMVHCLASETNNNLAVLNFRHHTTDHDISMAIRNLPPRCFLCIEDIDCLFEHRTNKNHNVSFASLLAALDGAFDMNGGSLTVFMTTNAIDALDMALRRRVDFAVEFTFASKQQCKRMYNAFFPHHPGFEHVWTHLSRHNFSTSVMQKFLVRCLSSGDPIANLDAFDALIQCTYGSTQSRDAMYV
jgi:hypothetical protein